jgi:hypothetical protein
MHVAGDEELNFLETVAFCCGGLPNLTNRYAVAHGELEELITTRAVSRGSPVLIFAV